MYFNYVQRNHDYCKQLLQNRVGLSQRPQADYDRGGDIFSPFQQRINTTEFLF